MYKIVKLHPDERKKIREVVSKPAPASKTSEKELENYAETMLDAEILAEAETIQPKEIEIMKPKINYGFITRGCFRKCHFCLVPEKEGDLYVEADNLFYDFWDKKSKNIIIMDATAGIDILGTSLFLAFDVLFFVIEPTKKSISVLKTFLSKTNVKVVPILNKVRSNNDLEYVKSEGVEPFIVLSDSNYLRLFEQGDKVSFDLFIKSNEDNFKKIFSLVKQTNRNTSLYYDSLVKIYKKSCENWYNNYFKNNIYEKTILDFSFLEHKEVEK
jgi:hypothetical protein